MAHSHKVTMPVVFGCVRGEWTCREARDAHTEICALTEGIDLEALVAELVAAYGRLDYAIGKVGEFPEGTRVGDVLAADEALLERARGATEAVDAKPGADG